MTDPTPQEPQRLWLSGFQCLRLDDDYAADVGRKVIEMLMRAGQVKREPGGPYRCLLIEVTCS